MINIQEGRPSLPIVAKDGGGFWAKGLAGGSEPLPDAGNYSTILNALYLNLYSDFQSWGAGDISGVNTWYYVDSAAAGGGDGSVGSPYTLAEAKALNLSAGEGLSLNPGTYSWPEDYTFTSSGSSGNPIYVKSTDPNNKAVINGGGTGKVSISGASYFGLKDLEITDTDGAGVSCNESVNSGCNNITIEGCTLRDLIGNQGDNIAALRMDRVYNSRFRNNKIENIEDNGLNIDGHAFETYRGFNNIFEHNEVINVYHGFYVKIPTANPNNGNIIRRNTWRDLRSTAYQRAGNAGDPQTHSKDIFAENLVYNSAGGIADKSSEVTVQPEDVYYVNNTLLGVKLNIEGTRGTRFWNNIVDTALSGEQTLILRSKDPAIYSTPEIVKWDYNFYPQGFNAYLTQDGQSAQSFNDLAAWQSLGNTGNPAINISPEFPDQNSTGGVAAAFTNAANGDYTLAAGSPCIGAGEGGDNIGAYATQDSVIGRVA